MRRLRWGVLGVVSIACGLGAGAVASEEVARTQQLRFVRAEEESRVLSLAAMIEGCGSIEVEVEDPYHERRMRYVGLPLRCVLDLGFSDQGGAGGLASEGLLLRAHDGYMRPVSGRVLLEPGGVLAYGEPALMASKDAPPRFSPIDRRSVDPAPFYLVWTGEGQGDPHESPWPYQLSTIEVAPFRVAFPHTPPVGLDADDPGWAGYALFQQACAPCHAVNGEGGKIGPDLNVPQNILEYRPVAQVRAYIRNPEAFRYTSMPAHPGLTETDLDALIAYFHAMRDRKHDPQARGGS